MKLTLLFGMFFPIFSFAANDNYNFKCSMTSLDGNITPFSGRMVKNGPGTFGLVFNQSVAVLDTSGEAVVFRSMACSNQIIAADYQGTAFSDCVFTLKNSDSISGRFLRLTWPSYDMLSLNLSKQASASSSPSESSQSSKNKKQFSHVTYLEEVPYGMSGGEQLGKKAAKLKCSVTLR